MASCLMPRSRTVDHYAFRSDTILCNPIFRNNDYNGIFHHCPTIIEADCVELMITDSDVEDSINATEFTKGNPDLCCATCNEREERVRSRD